MRISALSLIIVKIFDEKIQVWQIISRNDEIHTITRKAKIKTRKVRKLVQILHQKMRTEMSILSKHQKYHFIFDSDFIYIVTFQ